MTECDMYICEKCNRELTLMSELVEDENNDHRVCLNESCELYFMRVINVGTDKYQVVGYWRAEQ